MTSFWDRFVSFLHTSHGKDIDHFIFSVEKWTGLAREQISLVFLCFLTLYLVLGTWNQLVCNLIGFAYPAYASIKAIRSPTKEDDTQWLIYWTVFAFFSIVDTFIGFIFRFFPFYFVLKMLFLVYLYLPSTQGAHFCYVSVIDPAINYIEKSHHK